MGKRIWEMMATWWTVSAYGMDGLISVPGKAASPRDTGDLLLEKMKRKEEELWEKKA